MWIRQPQYNAQPDRSNSIGKRLAFWSFGFNHHSHSLATRGLAGASEPTRGGQIGYNAAGAASNSWAYDPAWGNHARTDGFSVFCEFYKFGNAASYARPFGRTAANGASPPYLNWTFALNPAGAGQDRCDADISTTTAPFFLDTIAINNIVTGRNTVAMSIYPTGFTGYSQGINRGSATVTPNNSVAGTDDVYIGSDGTSAQDTGSIVTCCLVILGALTDSEQRLLHNNPYYGFKTSERLLANSAAASAFQAAWARNRNQVIIDAS